MAAMTRKSKRRPVRRIWNEDGTLQAKECHGPSHDEPGTMVPAEEFSLNNGAADGRFARCRACTAYARRRRNHAHAAAVEAGEPVPAHWETPKVNDLYFVQCGCPAGEIKIGRGDPDKRIKSGQTFNAHDLALLARLEDGGHDEPDWHARFHHLRIRGEWFTPAPELLDAIQEACRKWGVYYNAKKVIMAPRGDRDPLPMDAVKGPKPPTTPVTYGERRRPSPSPFSRKRP